MKTPESLATLPNSRLMRRHDAVRAVWQRTPSENTAKRCRARLSVICAAASLQTSTPVAASLSLRSVDDAGELLCNV